MSKDEKAFQTLLGPTLEIRNKQNKVVLSMKRKGEKYGQLYYLFEIHVDRVEPEKLTKFQAAWDMIKTLAREMGVHLFNVEEVFQAAMSEVRKMMTTQEPPRLGEPFDVKIDVLNHATGKSTELTLSITAVPK